MGNITAIVDNGHNGKFSFCLAKVVERLATAPISTDVIGAITIISFPSRVDHIIDTLVKMTGAGDRDTFDSITKGVGHNLRVMSLTNDPAMWSKESFRNLFDQEMKLPSIVVLDGAPTEIMKIAEETLSQVNGDVYVTARLFLGPGERFSLPGPDILTEPADIFDKAARVLITDVRGAFVFAKTIKAPATDGGMPVFCLSAGSLRESTDEETQGAFEWYYRGDYSQEQTSRAFPKINTTVIKGRGNSRKTSFAISKALDKLVTSPYQEKRRRLVVATYENSVEEMTAIVKSIGETVTHDIHETLAENNISLGVTSLQHDASLVSLLEAAYGTDEEITLILDAPPSFFAVLNAKQFLMRCGGGEMFVVAQCARGFSDDRGDSRPITTHPSMGEDMYQDAWISGVEGYYSFFRKIKSSDSNEAVGLVMIYQHPFIVQSTAHAASNAFKWHDEA